MAIVCGLRDMAREFGVKTTVVKQWQSMGAPILQLGNQATTKMSDLWQWLVANRKKVEKVRA